MKIGVLGGNGYLGGRISSYLNKFFDTSSITRNAFLHPNCENIAVDYNSHNFISTLKNFDIILNCTGANKIKTSIDPKSTLKQKKQINLSIAKAASEKKIFVFHISSKHVYALLNKSSSKKNNFINKDIYAQNHLEAENVLIKNFDFSQGSNFQIIRLANCFGYSPTKSLEFNNLFMNQIISDMSSSDHKIIINKPKEYACFTSMEIVASFIKDTIQNLNKIENHYIDLGVLYGFKLEDGHNLINLINNKKDVSNILKNNINNYGANFIKLNPKYSNQDFFINEVIQTNKFIVDNNL